MKRYTCVRQHDTTDCGPACLATIAQYYGQKIPLSRIRQLAGTDRYGTNALGIIRAAEHLGFLAKAVRTNKEHLHRTLPLPCIAHVKKGELTHYVVIQHIRRQRMIVADPAVGLCTLTIEQFCQIWTGVLILVIPNPTVAPQEEAAGVWFRFAHLLKPYRNLLWQIFLASVLYTIFGVIGTFYLKILVDSNFVDGMLSTLHIISVGFLVLILLRIALLYVRNQILIYISAKLEAALTMQYFQHVLSLPLSFYDTHRVGEILARASDTVKIRTVISHGVVSVMLDSVMIIVVGVVLLLQNYRLFIITLCFIPLYVLIIGLFSRPYNKLQRYTMEQMAKLEAFVVEAFTGIQVLKAFSAERQLQDLIESKYGDTLNAQVRNANLRNLQSTLQSGLALIGELVILWFGGREILQGGMSVGQLVTYHALLAYFIDPIVNLTSLQPLLQEARIAAERLLETIDLTPEVIRREHKVQIPRLTGKIEFRQVEFRYGMRAPVLQQVSFQITAGEKIAIVGPSGSGKTTIAKLLLGYYFPTAGQVLFDDIQLEDLNLEDLRRRIGYVPQDNFFFDGTLLANLTLGLPEVELQQIINLADKLGLLPLIEQLPQRWHTVVGERGTSLSGGQKQRLALLRALLKQPDILILDEATNHLDAVSERTLWQGIYQLGQPLTMIIITHRFQMAAFCDKIIVINHGRVAEVGSHQQLLAKQGEYYRLWANQLGVEEVLYDQRQLVRS